MSRARRRREQRVVARLDRRLLAAAVRARTPSRNRLMTAASTAANRSALWIGLAAILTATGERRHRSAAASGLLGVGISATLVNGPLKFAWRRNRPPMVPGAAPLLPLPRTFSFPSGHAASALAFATGVSRALPSAAPVVLPLAATVAYSRVHTGVHYPSDVAVGGAFGVASGLAAAALVRRARVASAHRLDTPDLDRPVPRAAVLLTSEHSGSSDALDAARAALSESGIAIGQEIAVEDVDALARLVRTGATGLVIAAGGDGTVGAAAGAVVGTDALLAVLPLGTSNDVARSLGVPTDPVEAARAVADGIVRTADAGEVRCGDGSTRIFLHAVTTGLNVTFARLATTGTMRDRFGGLTYPIAAAAAVRRYEPFTCTVQWEDGDALDRPIVHMSVGNAPVFGGVLGMRVPGASMTDGLLDVIVVEPLSPARLALAVADSLVGRHRPVHRVTARRVAALRIVPDGEHQVAVDGEVFGAPPYDFRVLTGALRVVVPRRPAGAERPRSG